MKSAAFLIFAFSCFLQPQAQAVEVAFLIQRDANGKPVDLEPQNRHAFSHVAIRYGKGWLHAHPWGGVQISKSLKPFGEVVRILRLPKLRLSTARVLAWLGRPYDAVFSWSNERFYCSELVAKVLVGIRVQTLPMQFNGPYWVAYFQKLSLSEPPKGVGVSPDHLFETLLNSLNH